MTDVLDAASEAYHRQRFLAGAAAAYGALASDEVAAADYRRELAESDSTSTDGLSS
jgi:hypothetical protein